MNAKDLYFSDPERFSTLQMVFETVAQMSVSKNYYDADLFNIVEILTILEMQELVGNGRLKSGFAQYILDVILYSTPSVRDLESDLPPNWASHPTHRSLKEYAPRKSPRPTQVPFS